MTRIRTGNQLSGDARTLGFGPGASLVETDGDVEVSLGGSNTFLADLINANDGPVRNFAPTFAGFYAPPGQGVTFPTGYAGNDVVEPSILFDHRAPFFADANGLNGYEYIACIGGYSGTNALYENPNLWVSHDGNSWVYVVFATNGAGQYVGTPTPAYGGVLTPIVPSGVQGDLTISDPYMVRGPDGTYYILWNQFLTTTGGGTGDGSHDWAIKAISASTPAGPWSTPVSVVRSASAAFRPSSPSAVWMPSLNQWLIYATDLHNTSATTVNYYTVAGNNLLSTWVRQSDATIPVPAAYSGQVWWHLNVYRIGKQIVMIMQDTLAGSSGSGNLWLISSRDDGATWTVPPVPMMPGSTYYRAAAIAVYSDAGVGLDLFYGFHGGNWQVVRTTANTGPNARYGGISAGPTNALQMPAARVPIAPFVFGDAVIRVDSALTPGTADSGQAYTVLAGTCGVASHQLYMVTSGTNNKMGVVVAGAADGVYAAEMSVLPTDSTKQAWLLARFADGNNYIRFGTLEGAYYTIQNIVGGSVTGGVTYNVGITAGDILALVCKGSNVDVYVNGGYLGSVTYSSGATNSGIGFQGTANTARWRNLYMRALINGA